MANQESFDISYQLLLRISEILDEQKLTQTEFANRLGKDPAVVSRWFKGNHNFNLITIQQISQALGQPLIAVIPKLQTAESMPDAKQNATHQTVPTTRRKYSRKSPVSIGKNTECLVPDFSPEHRQKLAELPQVLMMKEVNRLRKLDQQDPDRWALWQYLYNRFVRNIGKHGSPTRFSKQGVKLKRIPIRYFVENEFRKGHSLLYHFPQLSTSSPSQVLLTLSQTSS